MRLIDVKSRRGVCFRKGSIILSLVLASHGDFLFHCRFIVNIYPDLLVTE